MAGKVLTEKENCLNFHSEFY